MSILISVIIMVGILLNFIFLLREGKDERWKHIISRPLNYAFSLLFMGYTTGNLISEYYKFDLNTYKTYYDYLFAGILVVYIVLLLIERRKLS
ncbi:hypothetical protein UY286_15615 [Paenibacillus polymyxa]|uniref:hypothetical protein n=1 Tax=Paenibacillus polymyxa TaxID=1406 RepID=UPI002AB3AAA5|nr:hypothetical protein [Paenibacillus polymyxa]MDY7992424.1 hypothetical protein [Paenibacillus polymyxa]MDY8118866.1 hypothetical protein [Paenibacillus polymyxa]